MMLADASKNIEIGIFLTYGRFMRLPLCALISALSLSVWPISASAAENYTNAVIPKGTTHEFWKSINAGAIKAERELNQGGAKVEVIWKGPLREDDRDQQIQVIENFISRRVSGIVVAPLDSRGDHGFGPQIRKLRQFCGYR